MERYIKNIVVKIILYNAFLSVKLINILKFKIVIFLTNMKQIDN